MFYESPWLSSQKEGKSRKLSLSFSKDYFLARWLLFGHKALSIAGGVPY
jgi:hypothetical protein